MSLNIIRILLMRRKERKLIRELKKQLERLKERLGDGLQGKLAAQNDDIKRAIYEELGQGLREKGEE